MAFRTWGKLLLTALGVSVLAGAGQLGVAYGFGIVRLAGEFTDATVNRWPAQLVWVSWFAAVAAVVGAVATERLARAEPVVATTTGQLGVAGAAALGATVVTPLCMQPARATELTGVDPVWAVGICAVLGAVVGAGAALAVLLRPPLGWNLAMVAGAVWLVALVSSLPALVGTGPMPTVRLGVFEPGWLGSAAAQRLAMLVLPLVALLAGAASGALARWRGHPPLIGGASGAAGPVLVAFAYLAAGPGSSVDRYQLAPYHGALIAVATGVLGSAAAALARWPLGTPGRAADQPAAPDVAAGDPAIEPTDILRPLPTGPAVPAGSDAGDADPVDPPASDAAAARRVPVTVGDPLPEERPGGTRDRAATGTPAGSTPAHWEWPMAAGAARATPATQAAPPHPTDPHATADAAFPADAAPPIAHDSHPTGVSPVADPRPADVRPADTRAADASPATDAARTGDEDAGVPAAPAPRPKRVRSPRVGTGPGAPAAETPPPADNLGPADTLGPTDILRPADTEPAAVTDRSAADAAGTSRPGTGVTADATGETRPGRPLDTATTADPTGPAGSGSAPGTDEVAAGAPDRSGTAAPAATPVRRRAEPAFFEAPSFDDVVQPAPPEPTRTNDGPRDPSPPAAPESRPDPVDPDPRPRPRRPLPDLGQVTSWDAFGNAVRRAGPTATGDRGGAGPQPPDPRPAEPGPSELGRDGGGGRDSSGQTAHPGPVDSGRTSPGPDESGSVDAGPASSGPGSGGPASSGPGSGGPGSGGPGSGGPGSGGPGSGGPGNASTAAGDAPEDPATTRSRLRRALFRRNRARTAGEAAPTTERDDRREAQPLPAQDEEYVDWVAGLARPVPDPAGGPEGSQRSLRSSGRHHRD
ncbi:hypothetical protein C5N14_02235 [Micromonospora sp. MW-13]|uniref:hypothetical protein n=1 Tax=Micromonospora sp. MW-13 TaxID=2094022 RepID=UPI000E439B4F|nr:hypothetical protein [Micromonospora sp. MW-13]RGC70668.1 hypothetical protein C5N14_02235 [Micromonospora sp. MW-13]